MRTTVGQLLINENLPSSLQDHSRVMNSKELKDVLIRVATDHPDQYSKVAFGLKRFGDQVSFEQGSSFSLKEFESPVDKKQLFGDVDKKLASIQMGGGSTEEKDAESAAALVDLSNRISAETIKTKLGQGSTLAKMVVSEARGKPSQLAQMVSSPVMFTDLKQRPILLPIKSSFAEGLKPDEYWASSYGARLGVISSKFATADAGAFGKQMAQATLGLVVTMADCGTKNGIPSTVDDNDNLDAFLAAQAGRFPRNTLITPTVLAELKREKVTEILVRSPITCEAPKGVCAKCRGLNDKNKLPALGENVGLASASAMAEPVTQMSLNVKHSGGAAGQGGIASGYKLLNQLTSVPSEFPSRAALATRTGKVTSVEPAPQGGTFTKIDGENHYSLPGFHPWVKVGDSVEEGDPLDGGIVNPAEVVVFKGIGEGRRQLVNKLRDAYKDAGATVGRRHFEVLSRALINQAQIDTDILPGSLPDDIVDFQALQPEYKSPTSRSVPVEGGLGKYLTKPVLHYTVGTKLLPSMVQELKKFDIKSIEVEDAPPPFTPMMVRMQDIPQVGSDWMSALYSRNLKVNLLKNVHRGAKAPRHSTSFIPSLAESVEFGRSPKGPPEY